MGSGSFSWTLPVSLPIVFTDPDEPDGVSLAVPVTTKPMLPLILPYLRSDADKLALPRPE